MRVEGIGSFDHHGEFWLLTYEGCWHQTQLPREMGYHNWEYTARVIREHYAECQACRWETYEREHPDPSEQPPPEPPRSDRLWWLQDVHADRRPPPRRPRASAVALSQQRVVIDGVFPHLVRLRLPAWSEHAVLYVERKRGTGP